MPGVGIGLAQTVVAHLDDPKRFTSAGKVGSYAGLTPRQDQSGESNRFGHITRRGPNLLRGMLTEVAWVGVSAQPVGEGFCEPGQPGCERSEEDCDCSISTQNC